MARLSNEDLKKLTQHGSYGQTKKPNQPSNNAFVGWAIAATTIKEQLQRVIKEQRQKKRRDH